jgi:prepilin-type N-terminal cleavage/methylation domain-containing protein
MTMNRFNRPSLTTRSFGKAAHRTNQRGFSLVEIALVLLIAGLALGAGISLLNAKLAQSKIDNTKAKTEAVRVALVNYVGQNFRLPCPADPSIVRGAANYDTAMPNAIAPCTASAGLITNVGGAAPQGASRGTVPCATLGLPEDTCIDGWGVRLTYFVQNSAVQLTRETVSGMRGTMTVHTITPPAAAAPAAGLAPTGNQINACNITANDNSCNLAAVAIIISHGANRGGGFLPTSATAFPGVVGTDISAYEGENTNNNIQFIQNDYVEAGVSSFDDILVAVVPRDIVSTLNQTGIVKQPNVFMNERFESIKQALLSDAYANSTDVGGTRTYAVRSIPIGTTVAYALPPAISFTGCPLPTTSLGSLPTPTVAALTTGIGGGIWRDTWNNPIQFLSSVTAVSRTTACITPIVLLSHGPDGAAGGGDDLLFEVKDQDIGSFARKTGGW